MKEKTTELVFILDRSGSMAGLESDTIGGFNAMIEKQKKTEGTVLVTTMLFSGESSMIHDRLPLREVPLMTEKEYFAGGCTALLDAVGGAITHVKNIHKYARTEDVPEKTLFVITTDGMENASHRFGAAEVKSLIEQQTALGWEFLFFGANIDAAETAKGLGIRTEHAVDYCPDAAGTALNYDVLSDAVCRVRCGAALDGSWKASIEKDFERRGKKRR